MARAELPSGAWVEYRDKLMAGDRFEVQSVVSVEVADGKNKANFYEMANDMRNAMLGRIITDWSYPVPIPSKAPNTAADIVLGNTMDLEDYAALEEAVEPLMDLITGQSRPDPKKQSGSS